MNLYPFWQNTQQTPQQCELSNQRKYSINTNLANRLPLHCHFQLQARGFPPHLHCRPASHLLPRATAPSSSHSSLAPRLPAMSWRVTRAPRTACSFPRLTSLDSAFLTGRACTTCHGSLSPWSRSSRIIKNGKHKQGMPDRIVPDQARGG